MSTFPSVLGAAALALTLGVAAAQAADDQGAYAIDGVGSRSCADLAKAYAEKDEKLLLAFASWTDGFITSYNIHAAQTFDITPWQTVELTLAKMNVFCQANPKTPYIEGLAKLMAVLKADRLTTSDELVLVRSGKQGTYLYRGMLTKIRAALQAAGIEVGSPEGSFDDSFAAALKSYQAKTGLPTSGLPDQQTLNALLH